MGQRQVKKQVHGQAQVVRMDSGPGFRTVLQDELKEILEAPLQAYKFVPEIRADDEGIEIHKLDFRQMLELPLRILTASEILWQLGTRHVGSFGDYEKFVEGIDWPLYLPENASVKVRCNSYRSGLYHEGKLEKIAREILAKKGHGDKNHSFIIRFEQKENRCTAYLAISLDMLYKRNYKVDYSHPAPLQEHLAAAAIRWSWGREEVDFIYVPFAGSGTMLMESWLYAHRPALDLWRPFTSLESMPEFPLSSWNFIKSKLAAKPLDALPARAIEWDNKGNAILKANLDYALTKWPAHSAPWECRVSDFELDTCPPEPKKIYIPMNPPYGLRLDEDTPELYFKLGKWLHSAFARDQHRFGFVLLADSKSFHAFEKGVGAQHMNGIMSFTQGGQHIRCVSFDIPST